MTGWQEDFAYGKFWVDHLVPWLKQRRVSVIRARDTGHDGAPLIELPYLDQPNDDLVLFWAGRVEFWEVKSKRDTGVLIVAGDAPTTGCDTKCVDQGYRVERETAWPVRFVFVHPHRNEVLLARLVDFDPRLTRGNGGARGERLSYCDIRRLEPLCTTDELLALEPSDKAGSVAWPAWLPKRKVVPQQQMLFELPVRRPPVGVKGWPRP